MWGIYQDEYERWHIAPCDEQGRLDEPHVLSPTCPCNPALSDQTSDLVHELIN